MSRLDDRITRELERVARPADPSDAFDGVDRRRHKRHVMHRIQAASLIVVVLAGTVGGVLVLTKAFRPAATGGGSTGTFSAPTPTPSSSPAPSATPAGPIDMGLGFPVCDPRTMSADMDGNGTLDTVTVATKMSDAPCPARGTSTEIVAIDLNGDGKADNTGGPLACPDGCLPFAAPDLDADGHPDLVLSAERIGDGTQRIEPFHVSIGGGMVPFTDPAGDPMTFLWGSDGLNTSGVACMTRAVGPLLIEWTATPTGPPANILNQSHGYVTETGYHVAGTELRQAFSDHYSYPGEETAIPDGGGSTMCGVPIVAPASP